MQIVYFASLRIFLNNAGVRDFNSRSRKRISSNEKVRTGPETKVPLNSLCLNVRISVRLTKHCRLHLHRHQCVPLFLSPLPSRLVLCCSFDFRDHRVWHRYMLFLARQNLAPHLNAVSSLSFFLFFFWRENPPSSPRCLNPRWSIHPICNRIGESWCVCVCVSLFWAGELRWWWWLSALARRTSALGCRSKRRRKDGGIFSRHFSPSPEQTGLTGWYCYLCPSLLGALPLTGCLPSAIYGANSERRRRRFLQHWPT